ncbi:MAG: hypothetical protein K8H86_02055, partial [Ignavibacteriaceae bacterium]|nr:hypothetical protein [Ignavibacteriaceae bacterium]
MSFEEIQNNKLLILGKLSASLLHEIRNPLSAIKLNLDYLEMIKNELPGEAVESVTGCTEAVQRIQHLIDMLLTFSRKDGSKASVCSLNEVVLSAIEIARGNSTRNNILLENNLEPTLPKIKVSFNKVLQVVLNLITNAIESCDKNGKVIVKTYQNGNCQVICEVEDNGIGISDEDKEKIFADFFTKKKEGTGLGLSVCKMLLSECN